MPSKNKKKKINKSQLPQKSGTPIDLGSMWIKKIGYESPQFFYPMYEYLSIEIYNKVLDILGKNFIFEIKDKEGFLIAYLNTIEEEMKKIIENYSLYELLYWTRRIAPMKIYSSSKDTVILYREVMNNAIVKYGSSINNYSLSKENTDFYARPEYVKDINQLLEKETPSKILTAILHCYKLEILSYLFIYGTQNYRMLCKGGVLKESEKFGFYVSVNKSTSYLINLYDERLEFNQLFTGIGTFLINDHDADAKYKMMVYQLNVDLESELELPDLKIKSNYIPALIDLKEVYDYMQLFQFEIFDYYSFSVEVFISFIYVLSADDILNLLKNKLNMYTLIQRAYMVTSNISTTMDRIKKLAAVVYEKVFGDLPVDYDKQIDLIIKEMSCSLEPPRNIDLWTGGPRRVILPCGNDSALIDYSGIHFIITNLLQPISKMDGETGNKKSAHFEKATNNRIIEIFGDKAFWVGSQEIENQNGNKKEFDASICFGEILYILECKSTNVSFAFNKGDPKSLFYRQVKNEEALNQIDSKADFLLTNYLNLNIPLPKGVKYIVPLVISPLAEYIWDVTEELFLDTNLPRILTLGELVKLKHIDTEVIKMKPFTRALP